MSKAPDKAPSGYVRGTMNSNLATIRAADEPRRFVNAAVLSPDDPTMDASDEALHALEDELDRIDNWCDSTYQQWLRIVRAIKNVKSKRKS